MKWQPDPGAVGSIQCMASLGENTSRSQMTVSGCFNLVTRCSSADSQVRGGLLSVDLIKRDRLPYRFLFHISIHKIDYTLSTLLRQ